MNPEIVFSVCHRHVSSPGECGWLHVCAKARGRHFEHLLLTGSVQSHYRIMVQSWRLTGNLEAKATQTIKSSRVFVIRAVDGCIIRCGITSSCTVNGASSSDVKFHEIFWRKIFHEIYREIFKKFHDGLWVQAV